MTNPSKGLTVTAVQHDGGVITAYFNELPALVVQGSSTDDVKGKLGSLLGSYLKRLDSNKDNFQIQTKCLA